MSSNSNNAPVSNQDLSDGATMMNLKILLIAMIILVVVILLIGAMHLYVRYVWASYGYTHWEWGWDRRNNLQNTQAVAGTAGLDKHILDALPTFVFTKDSAKEPLECSVCISEFQEDETCRLLPKCNHRFHTACIDMWFQTHSSCPLCRTLVVEEHDALQEDFEVMPEEEADASPHEVSVDIGSLISNPWGLSEGRTGTNSAESLQIPSHIQETPHQHQRQQEDSNPDYQAKQGKSTSPSTQYPVNMLFYGNKNEVNSRCSSRAERFQKFEHLAIEVPSKSGILSQSNVISGPRTTPPTPTSTPGNESRIGASNLETLKRMLSMREKRSSVPVTPKSSAENFHQENFTP